MDQVRYATFGRRLMAAVIDGVILSTAGVALSTLLRGHWSATWLSLVANLAYYVYFTGSRGQTLGKMALKIKVIRTGETLPPGYVKAALRETIGKFLSALGLGLGYIWMLWDKRRQTWHDKIARTEVIRI